jgi:hypothetical protein
MMQNLKAKEQNFTIANIFKRVGLNSVNLEYEFTTYFDGDKVPDIGTHSASILINCTNAATNPLLRNTNSERLKTINDEVSNDALQENERFYNTPPFDASNPNQLPAINPTSPYNSIRALAKLAEIFNTVQMHGVSGTEIPATGLDTIRDNLTNLVSGTYNPQLIQPGNARIGWNAAKQTQSTMLYVNSTVSIKGTLQDISSDLLSMKSGDKILIKTDTDAAADQLETIKAARLAFKRFGRKIKRGGRSLKRAIVEKFYNVYYNAAEKCEYVLAYVKQLTVIMKTLTPYKLKNCIQKLKVFMKNAFKVLIIPAKFVVAVYNGLKAVFEQRNANANAVIAQKAVDDANAALARAQQDAQDAQDAVDNAKQALADALNAQNQAAADAANAAAAAGLGDDFLSDIFQQGVSSEAEQDVVEKQAAHDAAEQVANDAAQQAQDAAQQAQDAAQQAQDAANAQQAASNGKWNAFVNAFFRSFEKFESFPANPARPTYEPASSVATTAKETLKSTNEQKLKKIVDANAVAAQSDTDEAAVDEAEAAAAVYNYRFEKSQMWMVNGVPIRNTTFPAIINIPVYHFRLRASNLLNLSGEEIENDTKLKVQFQKFSKEEVA